jgi:hypothetical protein
LRKKKIASKSFYKNFDQKNQKQISSWFRLSRFWAFLDKGILKPR